MAIPVARVHLAMANAALPGLLPTPPSKCTMVPLLPTPPCVGVTTLRNPVPKSSPPKPSRADADERWDARKVKPAGSPAPSGDRSRDGKSGGKPGRADSVERWDAHKQKPASPAPSSSSSSSSSCERPCDTNKRPVSRAASAKRWDAHKKPRPPLPATAGRVDDDGESNTGSNDMEILSKPSPQRAMYAGPGFVVASPEPRMLPMPSAFLVRVAA